MNWQHMQWKDLILNFHQKSKMVISLLQEKILVVALQENMHQLHSQHVELKAVIATSFARIFYRNSVDGAFLLPIEVDNETYQKISNSDQLDINIEKNEIKNITKNETYAMKPFSEIIAKIIAAGGLFKYKK